jgi:outer membrane protein OmpA-like peptidoglycan-associated protein
MNTTARQLFVLLFAFIASLSSAHAESSINNSELSSLRMWVLPHDSLEISNSTICPNEGDDCVIFVDQNAKLSVTNTSFGPKVRIFYDCSFTECIEFSNVTKNALVVEGRPPFLTAAAAINPAFRRTSKSMTNTHLQQFSGRIPTGEALELSNVHLCDEAGAAACVLDVSPQGTLVATNTVLGRRLHIRPAMRLLEQVEFSNVKFFGAFSEPQSSAQAPTRSEEVREQNEKLVADLAPLKLRVEETARGVEINLPGVYFEFNRSDLTPSASKNVTKIGDILSNVEGRVVSVEGHTDSVGSDEYNYRLSRSRAEVVREALVARGFSSSRIRATGFGESQPVSDNATDERRARNRRVEVIVENSGTLRTSSDDPTERLNREASKSSGQRTSQDSTKRSIRVGEANNPVVSVEDDDIKVGSGIHVTDKHVSVHVDGLHVEIDK